MTKIEFTDDNGNVVSSASIPQNWDEMTCGQVQFIFRRYDDYTAGKISPLQLNVEILFHLMGKRFRGKHPILSESDKAAANIYMLCEKCLEFIFVKPKEDGGVLGLSFNSVRNPLPAVRGGVARPLLTGPDSCLTNLTFGEFRQASAALNEFFKSGEVESLDECIACLYRRRTMRPNRAGRRVRPLDACTHDGAVKDAAALEPWQKNLIMMWFSACINFMQTAKIRLNGEEVNLALLYSGGNGNSGPAFTMNDILLQIARDGSIGNADRVDDEPLYSILGVMWSNWKENKRYEKQSAKNKKS